MLKMIICDDDKIFCSSFEDLVIEKQMSWLARSLKDWHDVKLS